MSPSQARLWLGRWAPEREILRLAHVTQHLYLRLEVVMLAEDEILQER